MVLETFVVVLEEVFMEMTTLVVEKTSTVNEVALVMPWKWKIRSQ